MTDVQKQMFEEISNIIIQIREKEAQLYEAQKRCPHLFRHLTKEEQDDQWMTVTASCLICTKSFGWRCKVSPDQICHYSEYMDCIHCGLPKERK